MTFATKASSAAIRARRKDPEAICSRALNAHLLPLIISGSHWRRI